MSRLARFAKDSGIFEAEEEGRPFELPSFLERRVD
jgi:hypothetical protein